ncbi:MAG: glycosyltransferase, partial [Phycisphaerae bacterium]|nr:glycosyltransferase [Phycisphaerae bacterium]
MDSFGRHWTPVSALRWRLEGNVTALRARDAALAERILSHCPTRDYVISADDNALYFGVVEAGSVKPLPNPLPAATAAKVVTQLASNQSGAPFLVAGLDQGWLWNSLWKLKVQAAGAPGHRPPLFLLCRELESLWLVLHLHDWKELLTDRRVLLFVGEDAVAQLQRFLEENPGVPWPRVAVTVDPAVWPEGTSLDSVLASLAADAAARREELSRQIEALYRGFTPQQWAEKLRTSPLRVLGITSLYTTFLQHSMRDWLAAMESLGHQTRLLIERYDHERPDAITMLTAVAEFRPDLLLMIDHYRGEFPFLPQMIPCVMWVQDRLPTIFRPEAGAAQGAMDYVMGYGRRDCVTDFGYPPTRFLETPVGVNEARFAPPPTGADTQPAGRFDVSPCQQISFVSHASTPPRKLVDEMIAQQPPTMRGLFDSIYQQLEQIYRRGEFVTQEYFLGQIVDRAIAQTRVTVLTPQALFDFVAQKLNNAFFRHQALQWLVEAGYELALYGNGWEAHPKFSRFARGPADNQTQLAEIYRRSAINLQITPFGSAHQRLFEGLCAGGFFLLRKVTGDDVEPLYRELWELCLDLGIRNTAQLRATSDNRVEALLQRISDLTGEHPLKQRHDFVELLQAVAEAGFLRMASTIWPEFPAVCFSTRQELLARVQYFLTAPDERRQIAESMRRRV